MWDDAIHVRANSGTLGQSLNSLSGVWRADYAHRVAALVQPQLPGPRQLPQVDYANRLAEVAQRQLPPRSFALGAANEMARRQGSAWQRANATLARTPMEIARQQAPTTGRSAAQGARGVARDDVPFDQPKALRDPENIKKLTDGRVVPVYVRKGAENRAERWLSFTIPDNITQASVLEKGMAIDGNQALWAVSGINGGATGWQFGGVFSEGHTSMPAALVAEERGIAAWLKEFGYDVMFS